MFTLFAVALSASYVFADDASGVTNIFKPNGAPARAIVDYTMLILAVCAVIFVIVVALLVYTVVRFRQRREDAEHEPPQVYGSNQIELAWTVIPILIVFVLTLGDRTQYCRSSKRGPAFKGIERHSRRSPVVVGDSLSGPGCRDR